MLALMLSLNCAHRVLATVTAVCNRGFFRLAGQKPTVRKITDHGYPVVLLVAAAVRPRPYATARSA